MANFEEAYATLDHDEGLYANDPRDHGGETFRGIARRKHPEWKGWARLDQLKAASASHAEFLESIKHDAVLNSLVPTFYKDGFWNPFYDRINSQPIATKLFNIGVNGGSGSAVKSLQLACLDCNEMVSADGKIGGLTVNAVNSADPILLLTAFKKRLVEHYQQIVAKDATQSCFLVGWCKRAMA